MTRILRINIQDSGVDMRFDFFNDGNVSLETGAPNLPSRMRPVLLSSPNTTLDQVFVQWRAHRPTPAKCFAHEAISIEDVSLSLGVDLLTHNELFLDRPNPKVIIEGWCRQPWLITLRGNDQPIRHLNSSGGRHMSVRYIFDFGYISGWASNYVHSNVSYEWQRTFTNIGTIEDHIDCPTCAVFDNFYAKYKGAKVKKG